MLSYVYEGLPRTIERHLKEPINKYCPTKMTHNLVRMYSKLPRNKLFFSSSKVLFYFIFISKLIVIESQSGLAHMLPSKLCKN